MPASKNRSKNTKVAAIDGTTVGTACHQGLPLGMQAGAGRPARLQKLTLWTLRAPA